MRTSAAGLIFACTSFLSGAPQQSAVASGESFLPESSLFVGIEAGIPLRDSKTLAADLILPKKPGRYPIVLVQTPYNKALTRAWFQGQGRWGADSLFTDTNYAFVVTDVRGKFASSRALTPGSPPHPGEDAFDVCSWIAKQEWSNGKIGTYGASALGRVQYETARANPPNLICAVPSVAPLVIGYDTYFPGGALWQEFGLMLSKIGFGAGLLQQIASRPLMNDQWRSIEATAPKAEDMRVPMLLVGGWYDIYTDLVLDSFLQIRAKGGENARRHSKLIIGPWIHAYEDKRTGSLDFPAAEWYGMKKARAFLDYWLRDTHNGFDENEPAISYYRMGADEWRGASTWPPNAPAERRLYLRPDRSLAPAGPVKSAPPLVIRFDPARPVPTVGGHVLDPELKPGPQDQHEQVELRDDVFVLSTPPLERTTAILGKASVDLYVSSDRTDTDFVVILTDVYPDGRSMLVEEGIQRMRFRNGTSREEFMKPGKVYRIRIPLANTVIDFPKGHRIRLIVTSSSSPKYAVNHNDGGPMYDSHWTGKVATNHIYCDRQHPSMLVLPIAGAQKSSLSAN